MCKTFILDSYVAEKFPKQKFSEVFWSPFSDGQGLLGESEGSDKIARLQREVTPFFHHSKPQNPLLE